MIEITESRYAASVNYSDVFLFIKFKEPNDIDGDREGWGRYPLRYINNAYDIKNATPDIRECELEGDDNLCNRFNDPRYRGCFDEYSSQYKYFESVFTEYVKINSIEGIVSECYRVRVKAFSESIARETSEIRKHEDNLSKLRDKLNEILMKTSR